MIKPVVYWPHKALRYTTIVVDDIHEDVVKCCEDLRDTMHFLGGIGMAAPQIDEPYNIFVISTEVLPEDGLPIFGTCRVFINPQIVRVWGEEVEDFEGCLSFPSIFLKAKRPTNVHIKAQHIDGTEFEMQVGGLLSRAIQHEYDHNNGRLMVDFVGKLKQELVKKKLQKWKKKHDAK